MKRFDFGLTGGGALLVVASPPPSCRTPARHCHAWRAGAAAGFHASALCQSGCAAGRRAAPGDHRQFRQPQSLHRQGHRRRAGFAPMCSKACWGATGTSPFRSTACWRNRSMSATTGRPSPSSCRPEAKFSDGKPVTAADIVFSMETLRDKGRPNFKNSYSKITKIETPDDHTVVFHQEAGDRELPLIIGVMPIIPKHAWEGKAFDESDARSHHRLRPLCDRRGEGGREHHLPQEPRLLGQGPRHRQGPVEFRRSADRLLPRRQCGLRGLQEGLCRYPRRERSRPLGHGL